MRLVAFVSLVLLCGCQRPSANPSEKEAAKAAARVRWSAEALGLPESGSPTKEFAKAYEDTVAVSLRRESAAVKDCASNLDLMKRGYEPKAAVNSQALQAMAVRCLALKALSEAASPAKTFLTENGLEVASLAELPAALALAVSQEEETRREKAQAQNANWSQFDPTAKARTGENQTLLVQSPGWEQRLQILGRGDFNADGMADWLVQDEGWAMAGTYRSVRLFLLTRTEAGGSLKLLRELRP